MACLVVFKRISTFFLLYTESIKMDNKQTFSFAMRLRAYANVVSPSDDVIYFIRNFVAIQKMLFNCSVLYDDKIY